MAISLGMYPIFRQTHQLVLWNLSCSILCFVSAGFCRQISSRFSEFQTRNLGSVKVFMSSSSLWLLEFQKIRSYSAPENPVIVINYIVISIHMIFHDISLWLLYHVISSFKKWRSFWWSPAVKNSCEATLKPGRPATEVALQVQKTERLMHMTWVSRRLYGGCHFCWCGVVGVLDQLRGKSLKVLAETNHWHPLTSRVAWYLSISWEINILPLVNLLGLGIFFGIDLPMFGDVHWRIGYGTLTQGSMA